jgi:hypothetical protein
LNEISAHELVDGTGLFISADNGIKIGPQCHGWYGQILP